MQKNDGTLQTLKKIREDIGETPFADLELARNCANEMFDDLHYYKEGYLSWRLEGERDQ